MKSPNRLYVSGNGETLQFHSSTSLAGLKKTLPTEQAETVRTPNPDDLRDLWRRKNLYPLTNEQIAEMFDVSRQAVCMWRRKAGIKEEFAHVKKRRERAEKIKALLSPERTAFEIAEEVGTTAGTVRRVAEKAGITLLVRSTKRPSDSEIVKLAAGKTWRELAAACGVELASLRQYVYANPALAEKLRRKLARTSTGSKSHGKIDVDRLVSLYRNGLSAYQIARHFNVETPSAVYWIRKLHLDKVRKEGEPNDG